MQSLCFYELLYPPQHLVPTRLLIWKKIPAFFRWGNWGLEEKGHEFILGLVQFPRLETSRLEWPAGSWAVVRARNVDLGSCLEEIEDWERRASQGREGRKVFRGLPALWGREKTRRRSHPGSGRSFRQQERVPCAMWCHEGETQEALRKGGWNWWVQAGPVASYPPTSK